MNLLKGKEQQLKHGYVAVQCRSQDDIENGMTIKDCLEREENFFKNTKLYSALK